MALAASTSTQLGCGRDIDQVWDRLDQAPDAHELGCPYCQAARADLADLATATQAMRDDTATNPDLEPSPGLLDRILAVARTEVRRGRRLPLDRPLPVRTSPDQTSPDQTSPDQTSPGQTSLNTVSEQAVSAVVRRAGDSTRQVQIRRCALTLDENPQPLPAELPVSPTGGGADDVGPSAVAVSLRVSVAADLVIADVSNQLRTKIIAAVLQEVGMQVTSVDITVEDLHDV